MKRLLLSLSCAMLSITSLMAQTDNEAQTIMDAFVQKTGLSTAAPTATQSLLMEMEMKAMGMTIPMKVVTRGDKYRIDITAQGQNMLLVGDSTVAYMTGGGHTHKITDQAQLKQMVPFKDMNSKTFFNFSDSAVVAYAGQEGKGKKLVDVITVSDNGEEQKLYFSATTGMLETIEATAEGQKMSFKLQDYTQFDNGKVTIPTKINIKAAGQSVDMIITKYQPGYPTAPWMFALPVDEVCEH